MKTKRKISMLLFAICFSHFAIAQIGNSLDAHLVKLHSGKTSKIFGFSFNMERNFGTSDKFGWKFSSSIAYGGKSTTEERNCYEFTGSSYQESTYSLTYRYFYGGGSLGLRYFITGNDVDGGLYGTAGLGYRMLTSGQRFNGTSGPSWQDATTNEYVGGDGRFHMMTSDNDEVNGLCFVSNLGYEFPALDFGNLYFELGYNTGLGPKNTDPDALDPNILVVKFGVKWLFGN